MLQWVPRHYCKICEHPIYACLISQSFSLLCCVWKTSVEVAVPCSSFLRFNNTWTESSLPPSVPSDWWQLHGYTILWRVKDWIWICLLTSIPLVLTAHIFFKHFIIFPKLKNPIRYLEKQCFSLLHPEKLSHQLFKQLSLPQRRNLSTGTGCPQRLWSLLWRYSRPTWTRSCAACSRWPCFSREGGLDDPQRSLPTPTILGFWELELRGPSSQNHSNTYKVDTDPVLVSLE